MSYGLSSELQTAVFQALENDPALPSLVNGAIHDALPQGALPETYISLGPEYVKEANACGSRGAWHDFVISVVSTEPGFRKAKMAAGAVNNALHEADLQLDRGNLISLTFLKARAARLSSGARRIDLTFRARVEEDEQG